MLRGLQKSPSANFTWPRIVKEAWIVVSRTKLRISFESTYTGKCEKSNSCIFKHEVMSTTEEIMNFISENEDFLVKLYAEQVKQTLASTS